MADGLRRWQRRVVSGASDPRLLFAFRSDPDIMQLFVSCFACCVFNLSGSFPVSTQDIGNLFAVNTQTFLLYGPLPHVSHNFI